MVGTWAKWFVKWFHTCNVETRSQNYQLQNQRLLPGEVSELCHLFNYWCEFIKLKQSDTSHPILERGTCVLKATNITIERRTASIGLYILPVFCLHYIHEFSAWLMARSVGVNYWSTIALALSQCLLRWDLTNWVRETIRLCWKVVYSPLTIMICCYLTRFLENNCSDAGFEPESSICHIPKIQCHFNKSQGWFSGFM